ncbi:MAG: DUF2530 domain-containing protein [Actinomycetes bacterium]
MPDSIADQPEDRAADSPAPQFITRDSNGVVAVATGTALWLLGLATCLLARESLAAAGHGWWTWVCAVGAALGALGLAFVWRRRSAYAATKA